MRRALSPRVSSPHARLGPGAQERARGRENGVTGRPACVSSGTHGRPPPLGIHCHVGGRGGRERADRPRPPTVAVGRAARPRLVEDAGRDGVAGKSVEARQGASRGPRGRGRKGRGSRSSSETRRPCRETSPRTHLRWSVSRLRGSRGEPTRPPASRAPTWTFPSRPRRLQRNPGSRRRSRGGHQRRQENITSLPSRPSPRAVVSGQSSRNEGIPAGGEGRVRTQGGPTRLRGGLYAYRISEDFL